MQEVKRAQRAQVHRRAPIHAAGTLRPSASDSGADEPFVGRPEPLLSARRGLELVDAVVDRLEHPCVARTEVFAAGDPGDRL